jgi:hypothetical protein
MSLLNLCFKGTQLVQLLFSLNLVDLHLLNLRKNVHALLSTQYTHLLHMSVTRTPSLVHNNILGQCCSLWRYLHAVADMQFNFAWRFPESNLEIPVNECNGENDLFSIWRVIHWDELCISQTGFCFVFLRRKNISTLSSYRKVSDKTIEKTSFLLHHCWHISVFEEKISYCVAS